MAESNERKQTIMSSFKEQCRKEAEKAGLDDEWLFDMSLDMLEREGMEDKFLFQIRYSARESALAQLPEAIRGAFRAIHGSFTIKTTEDQKCYGKFLSNITNNFGNRSDEYKMEVFRECQRLLEQHKKNDIADSYTFSRDGQGGEALRLLDLILS